MEQEGHGEEGGVAAVAAAEHREEAAVEAGEREDGGENELDEAHEAEEHGHLRVRMHEHLWPAGRRRARAAEIYRGWAPGARKQWLKTDKRAAWLQGTRAPPRPRMEVYDTTVATVIPSSR